MTTIEYVVATALSLLMLVVLTNVVLIMYARGVVRSALDEGVRAGAPARLDDPTSARVCRAKVHEVLDGLLGGPLGAQVRIDCGIGADGVVRASATSSFDPWIPGSMPTWNDEARASARKDDR